MMEKKYGNRNLIHAKKLSLVTDKTVGLTSVHYLPVKIEVIEKYRNGEKVLIDGRLFVTNLPVNLEVGEIVCGKVIKNNPLTVSLDIKKENNDKQIDKLLRLLGIKKNPIAAEALSLLLVMQKPLVKSYTEEFIAFLRLNGSNYAFDELKVLANLIWNKTGNVESFAEIFNESFQSICEKIFGILGEIKIESGKNKTLDLLWSSFVIDDANDLDDRLNNKNERLAKGLKLFGDRNKSDLLFAEMRMERLKNYLKKYLLQKSYYASTGIYKDFVVLKGNSGYKFYFYKYETEREEQVANLLITTNYENEKMIGYLTENILYGEIHAGNNILEAEYLIEKFNRDISTQLRLKSFLRFKPLKKSKHKNRFGQFKSAVNYS